MIVLSHSTENNIREETYTLEDEVGVLIYKEWIDEKGKCIDCELRDKEGNSLDDDPELLERVQKCVSNPIPT